MTLVDRVSMFFLAALALVLVGYSLLAYGVVRYYLYSRFDEQLYGAFNSLVAAVEVEFDDVKFEPTDHTIRLGVETDVDDIRWAIYDGADQLVAHSHNLSPRDAARLGFNRFEMGAVEQVRVTGDWRLLQHLFAAVDPKPASQRDPLERERLLVTVARSTLDLRENLRSMAFACVVLPLAVWLAAALVGRWYCRRALAPVTSMARQARSMPDRTEARLEVAATGDELAELGAAFNQLLDRLHESLDRQRRFTGDAAHQLRTPLTVLQGHLDVALRRPRTTDEYRDTLAVLRTQTGELGQLVESLLYLASAASDIAPVDWGSLSLSEWLAEYGERWKAHPRWPDLRFSAGPEIQIATSPQLLAQLLDNLINNALKYSPAGSQVSVSAMQHKGRATLAVTDRGMGISLDEQSAIFQPFFRTAASRSSGLPGTGLGLSISQRLAAALHADLSCESVEGQGSTFAIAFL